VLFTQKELGLRGFIDILNPPEIIFTQLIFVKSVQDLGYVFEGDEGYLYTSNVAGTVPFYKHFYKSSSRSDHYYTTVSGGVPSYSYEGIAGHIFPNQQTGTTPLYRYFNVGILDHFYTITPNWSSQGYVYEGIAGYVVK
jgi:hypothetical protein